MNTYVMPDEIDNALGRLAEHCIVPREMDERNAVLRSFETLARAGRELRVALELEAATNGL